MQTKSFIMAMLGLLPAAITGVMAQATLSNLCLKDWLMDGSYMYVACKNIGGALQWSKLDVDAFLINRGQKSLAFADG